MKSLSTGTKIVAVLLVLFALFPLVWPTDAWLGFGINILLMCVLAIGWNISGGFGGMLSFGHAALFGTGAYAAAMFQLQAGLSPWVAAVAGVLCGALIGAFIGAVSFRYGLRGSYFSLVTLAFAEVLRVVASSFDFMGGGSGLQLPLVQEWSSLQFPTRTENYWFALVLVIVAILLSIWIKHSRFGAYLAAIRENEDASKALGINTFRVKVAGMFAAGAVSAAAGVAYLQTFLYIDAPIAYGSVMSIEALLGATIGGAGTILGPVLGTVLLHSVSELVKGVVGNATGLNLVFYGVLLLLILRFMPNGVMGLFERIGARRSTRNAGTSKEEA